MSFYELCQQIVNTSANKGIIQQTHEYVHNKKSAEVVQLASGGKYVLKNVCVYTVLAILG